jgi:hypothetical protein
MPKMLALAAQQLSGGTIGPNLGGLAHRGFVQCDPTSGDGNWASYIITGTANQLQAINALASVIGLVAVTESGDVRWAELDGTPITNQRNALNTKLAAQGWPTVPSGWTWRQIVRAAFRRLNDAFDFDGFDVADS